MAPTIIDDEAKLKLLLDRFTKRATQEQLVFMDLEGVNLGRLGTVAIMQLLMPPDPVVYLVDVHVLGLRAFNFTSDGSVSLKSILESASIFKVIFDVRNDSDALHAHFGINMAGVIDLQILEFATRQRRGNFLSGLARCVEMDLPYTPGWSLAKANGKRLFDPAMGGKYEVFLERPISTDIATYCENDVLLMPKLLACYGSKLRPNIAAQIQTIVDDRIRLSKTATYNGKGRDKAIGPSIQWWTSARVDTKISPEVALVCSSRLPGICRVDNNVLDDLTDNFGNIQIVQESLKKSDDLSSAAKITTIDRAESTTKADTSSETAVTISLATLDKRPRSALWIEDFETGRREYEDFDDEDEGFGSFDHDSDSGQDFTACSADDCGYCGKCDY